MLLSEFSRERFFEIFHSSQEKLIRSAVLMVYILNKVEMIYNIFLNWIEDLGKITVPYSYFFNTFGILNCTAYFKH